MHPALQLWNTNLRQLPSGDMLGPFTPVFASNKPQGALWTSEAVRKGDGYSSAWIEWCHQNEFPLKEHNILLQPDEDCRLFVIHTREDLLAMQHVEQPLFFLPDGRSGPVLRAIDFAAYARSGFDGICVTEETIFSCRDYDGSDGNFGTSDTLSFWDVPSTCWFRTDHLRIVEETKN